MLLNLLNYIIIYIVIIVILILLVFKCLCYSQVQSTFALSQSVSNDWKAGSVQTFEVLLGLDTKQQFNIDTICLDFLFRANAGALYEKNKEAETEYIRPTDNELFGELVFRYPLGWMLDPFVAASLQTQLVESFKYQQGRRIVMAKLWDPVTTQQSFGFAYSIKKEKDFLISRIGLSFKQIRAERYTQMTDDKATKDIVESYKAETGIQWKTDCNVALTDFVLYKGSLDSFGTFENLSRWSVKWLNELQFKVWEFLAVTFKLDIIYDEKQIAELQYKQSLRFGIVTLI